MATLSQTVAERIALENQLSELTAKYQKEKDNLVRSINKCKEDEQCYSDGLDVEAIERAKKVVYVYGNPYAKTEDTKYDGSNYIAVLAINDIATGCRHLKREFYGNKTYEAYYQGCNCRYGWGPAHGSIRDEVGLTDECRSRDLTEQEKNDAIYFLKVYQRYKESIDKTK